MTVSTAIMQEDECKNGKNMLNIDKNEVEGREIKSH